MTNEAVIVEHLGNRGEVIDFTVADGTGISKGTLMSGADSRTALANQTTTEAECSFVGIAAADKEASDGAVNVGLYTKVIADLTTISGSGITEGDLVKMSGGNLIDDGVTITDIITGRVVGKALATPVMTDTGRVIEVAVGVY